MGRLKLSQLAGTWSRDRNFIAFLNATVSTEFGLAPDQRDPADHIRSTCRVASRRDLDTDPQAAKTFDVAIRKPYMRWAEQCRNNPN
ncbi:hypothetical protein [Burkholderia stagnalis]|uniref:hypothetical protein n=1 Tax=Burkholderia stagnalis TaxID=1503054 RepID=UPI000F581C89|nr:hypothetical protein [Burkholderia stagnalis]RQR11365.1 hypothetical protein DF025_17385 [Burkholderia stagnalis]RQR20365.1 hypothetical protein DF026_17195 [Burkholderia stagnalis]